MMEGERWTAASGSSGGWRLLTRGGRERDDV